MDRSIKGIAKVEKMICSECGKDRLKTDSGICLICNPRIVQGTEVKQEVNTNMYGTEIKSRTGTIKENAELSRK